MPELGTIALKVIALLLVIFTMGIGATTLYNYAIGHPERTAWTGFVAMSSPEAVAIICYGIALLILIYDRRRE